MNRYPLLASILCAWLFALPAWSIDYTAVGSGQWHSETTWSPVGVPGIGDRVVALDSHNVTLEQPATIGDGTGSVAIRVNGSGGLILATNATLTVNGHFDHAGYRSQVEIRANAALLFNPGIGQVFEYQQNSSEQRLIFAGLSGQRARIGLAPSAGGNYYFSTVGFRDSLLQGSYGLIEDAFNPTTEQGWRMFLNNTPGRSELVAHHIEFRRCGEIGVFGLGAGEHTKVDLDAISFREQSKSSEEHTRPAFWFDGYGDVTEIAPSSETTKSISNLISDTKINLRFVQGYTLDNFVLGAEGSGNVRSNNNGGNALSHSNVFMASTTPGSGTNLIADKTENTYFYSNSDNPHGWSTQDLRGDALLSNYWFEAAQPPSTDRGDAVLTNGPQRFVSQYQGAPPTLHFEHSGLVGTPQMLSTSPTLVTFNNSEGIRIDINHVIAASTPGQPVVALDENGVTPTNTGIRLVNSVVFGQNAGVGIGSASASVGVAQNAFAEVNNNIYHRLARNGVGGRFDVHQAPLAADADQLSVLADPQLLDGSRNLASWDAYLGGPGTAEHAIQELLKRNDDVGFDSNYDVSALIAWVAEGHSSTNTRAVGADNTPMGPNLHYPSTFALIVGNAAVKKPSETLIIRRLEEQGFLVRVYDDDQLNPVSSEFSNAILISSTVNSAKIGDRFKDSGTPVMTWKSAMYPLLGLTGTQSGTDWGTASVTQAIEVLSPARILTDGFAPGELEVFRRPRLLGWGTPGSSAIRFASLLNEGDKVTLFGYDANTQLADGTIAAAKRLGWYEQGSNNQLRTSAGDTLFDRSVAWLLDETPVEPIDPIAPEFSEQPQDIIADEGETVTLNVAVSGTPDPQISWFRNGEIVQGETGSELSFTVTSETAGTYYAEANNEAGSAVSDPAEVSITLDTTPPSLVSATAEGAERVLLQFSEDLSTDTAAQTDNYTLAADADPNAEVLSATLVETNQVVLETTELIDDLYTITVSNVTDLSDNAIESGASAEFAGPSDTVVIAFVVGNPSLRAGDREVRTELENLGYEVAIFDDSEVGNGIESASLVLISATVSPTVIGSSFSSYDRPIMVWEAGIFGALGLTGNTNNVDFGVTPNGRRSGVIVEQATPAATELPSGVVSLTSRFHRQTWGKPGADATIISTIVGDGTRATVFRYASGATLANGNSASARRVGWFATDLTAKDWSSEARQLFKENVEWALSIDAL